MICCTEPGLTRPCIYCIYIKCVTCKMGGNKTKLKEKNLTMDNYCWQLLTRDRPDLSSERAPNKDNTAKFRINIWSQVPRWARRQDILTDWPSVVTRPQTSRQIYVVQTSVSTTTWTSTGANSQQDLQDSSATSAEAQTDCITSINKVVQQLI
jgi:hypothetical protein